MSSVITLTTDFGSSDAYVAAMKGVILSINPQVTIIDLCHSIPPQNIFAAAFMLHTSCPYFPAGTIHLVVVDPGVGSQRRAVLLITPSAFFVAPDNGVLSYIIEQDSPGAAEFSLQIRKRELGPGMRAIVLSNPRFWRHPVSFTFHGRDIFAPVAAHLSRGVPPDEFGEETSYLLAFPLPRSQRGGGGELTGHIIHIDHFGNLITDIRRIEIPGSKPIIEVAGRRIEGLSTSYQHGGELLAVIGSSDYLEIAAKNDSAARRLGAKVGDRVIVFPPQEVDIKTNQLQETEAG
jgi:hypothetical protein